MNRLVVDPNRAERVADIAKAILAWAAAQASVQGLALIGSHARGEARPDSDIDFLALALDPEAYAADSAWLGAIAWPGMRLVNWQDERYGLVWSRRLWLEPACEVELSFGPPSWAALNPVDAGTRKVVLDGFGILYDPDGLMKRLYDECRR
jgi:uncharacterized protein